MTQEQEKTMQALKTAIQMEIDGKAFYLKAADASQNPLGKKLLKQLAAEEDIHRQVFENIYNKLGKNQGWPETHVVSDSTIKTILADAKNQVGKDTKALKEEIDAVKTAMELENKTFDFYRAHAAKASYPQEKKYFMELADQEEGHHKALLSYYEFLKDPEAWFVQTEHHSLDGG